MGSSSMGTGNQMGNMGGGGSGMSSSNLGMMGSLGSLGGDSRSGMGGLGQLGGMGDSLGGNGMSSSMMGGNALNRSNNRQTQETTSIVVRNLPYSFTWQNLKEKFQDCGDVRFTEIKMDNGKSKGWGTVRFQSPEDARRAVNLMNGARIEGRMIDVRLDK